MSFIFFLMMLLMLICVRLSTGYGFLGSTMYTNNYCILRFPFYLIGSINVFFFIVDPRYDILLLLQPSGLQGLIKRRPFAIMIFFWLIVLYRYGHYRTRLYPSAQNASA